MIDLSKLDKPVVIEQVSSETILAEMLVDLGELDSGFADSLEVGDPAYNLLLVAAARESTLRQQFNDRAYGTMLAFASGSDLDHLCALLGVTRLVLVAEDLEATPPVLEELEGDASFRTRAQQKLESITTAGSSGAYIFHSREASPLVVDVAVQSPNPTEVLVTVLSSVEDGTADEALLTLVSDALNADDVRPLTDMVTVQSAEITEFTVTAELEIAPGPDSAVVIAQAIAKLEEYLASRRKIGSSVPLSGIISALHQPGVDKVILSEPESDIDTDNVTAGYCTDIDVTEAEE